MSDVFMRPWRAGCANSKFAHDAQTEIAAIGGNRIQQEEFSGGLGRLIVVGGVADPMASSSSFLFEITYDWRSRRCDVKTGG